MIENDMYIRAIPIYDGDNVIALRKECVITKEEFLECFNEWVVKPSQENTISSQTKFYVPEGKKLAERPHVIDNCDMNVFEPEKYMKGGAE